MKDVMAVTQEKKQRMADRFPKALLVDLDDTILADSDPGDDCRIIRTLADLRTER